MALDFRPLRRDDFHHLQAWFRADHVRDWWGEASDLPSIELRYGPIVDEQDPTEVFVIHRDGEAIAMVQRYLIDENPEWKRALGAASAPQPAAGIDYLIGVGDLTGRGIGPALIGQLVEDTWRRYPGVAAVVVAVDQRNRRSWRALEKAGFRRSWAGTLESDDPSDQGPSYVYVLPRSSPAASASDRRPPGT